MFAMIVTQFEADVNNVRKQNVVVVTCLVVLNVHVSTISCLYVLSFCKYFTYIFQNIS